MRPGFTLGWGLLLASVAAAVSAEAAPDAERLKAAAEEFDSGRRAYKLRDFESAASHFENADRDAPSPDALLAAIRSRREARQLARAATLSVAGLARFPNDKSLVETARQVIEDAQKSLYEVSVTCSPECTLVVDNKLMPFSETPRAVVYLDPGSHTLVAGWPRDRHVSRKIDATSGAATRLDLEAPPEAPVAVAPATLPEKPPASAIEPHKNPILEKSGLPPAVFFTGVGVTALLGGITIWSGIDTENNPGVDAVKQSCRDTSCALYQQGLDHQRRTNVLLGATVGAGLLTGIVGLFFTKWGQESQEKDSGSEANITPLFGVARGVTVGAVGRF